MGMRCKLCILFAAFFVGGCATVGSISDVPYYPSNPGAMLLKHTGDLQATASASMGGETVTGAYALTSHTGLLASGSMSLHKSGDPNGNQYSGEMGFGVFDTAARWHTYTEVYGGLGWGAGNANINTYLGSSNFDFGWSSGRISGAENRNFWKGWLQGDAGYLSGNFSLMAILRIEYVNLYHDVTSGIATTQYGFNDYTTGDTTYSTRGTLWGITPGLEARYRFDRIQLLVACFAAFVPGTNSEKFASSGAFGAGYLF